MAVGLLRGLGRRPRASWVAVLAALACLAGSAAWTACGGSGGGGPAWVTGVAGLVEDSDGAALAGVTVGFGGLTTVTDDAGRYVIEVAPGDGVVTFTRDGYVTVRRPAVVHAGSQSRVAVTMKAETAPVLVDVTAGGEADGPRNAKVVIPAGALVDGDGAPVTGEVAVSLTPLDPSVPGELAAYPGDFRADTSAGGTVYLETFGVMDVTIRKDGEELDVAAGAHLTVSFPAPAANDAPPAVAGLWSFDEAKARWIEEGTATYDAATHTFTAELPHLSPWNIDQPTEVTCVTGRVVDAQGNPVGGGNISARGDAVAGQGQAFADGDGRFCLFAPLGIEVVLTADHPNGGGAQKTLTVGATPVSAVGEGIQLTCPATSGVCTDAGELVVRQGVFDDGTTSVLCEDIADPFTGTCAEPLIAVYRCFRPSGACVIRTESSGGSVTEWDNGSKQTISYDAETQTATGTMTGPTGALCARTELNQTVYTVIDTSDRRFRFEFDGGSQRIACETTGGEVVLTPDQVEALDACSGNDDAACTIENGGQCETAADCDGLQCCAVAGSTACLAECPTLPSCGECASGQVCCQLPGGAEACVTQETCDAAQGCQGDNQCASGQECCAIAGSSYCVPVGSCPSF